MSKMGERLKKQAEDETDEEPKAFTKPKLRPISEERKALTDVADQVALKLTNIGVPFERNVKGAYATATFVCQQTPKTRGETIVVKTTNEGADVADALGELLFLERDFLGNILTAVFPEDIGGDAKRIFSNHRVGVWIVNGEDSNIVKADVVKSG